MLKDLFGVLKDALVEYIRLATKYNPTSGSAQDVVAFADWKAAGGPIEFKSGALTIVLLNLEEDRKALPADPYRRTSTDGKTIVAVSPPVPLNVSILFVSKFGTYAESLGYLDLVVRFFQKYRAMEPTTMPKLVGKNIDKILCELVTLPLAEMNHIWGPVATAYIPSLVYRLRVVYYHDADGVPAAALAKPSIIVAGSSMPAETTKIRWAYYCVTNVTDAASYLRIMDTAATSPLAFDAVTNLKTSPDTNDMVGTALVNSHSNDTVLRFVLSKDVNPDELSRKTIVLQRKKGSAWETLPQTLDEPSALHWSRVTLADKTTPVTWTSTTACRDIRWAYYCITNLTDAALCLSMADTATANALAFTSARDLVKNPDSTDVLGTYLASRHATESVLRFVSTTPVALDSSVRQTIELRISKKGDAKFDVLSKPLANPSPDGLSIIKHKLATSDTTETQCHVVTCVIEYRA